MQTPPLTDMTNPTSPPCTLMPAGEFESETLSLTAQNLRYTNVFQCLATLSPKAEALSPGNPSDNAALP